MGEMADEAWEQALLEDLEMERPVPGWLSTKVRKGGMEMNPNFKLRYTEDILNSTKWVTAQGEVIPVEEMDDEHLRNTLRFIYKNRDRYWLNCRNAKLIEQFDNGEDFFQRVVRYSTLWKEAIRVLTQEGATGFNFTYESGQREEFK